MRRSLVKITLLLSGIGCIAFSPVNAQGRTKGKTATASIATTWADMTVRMMTKAPKNTPTYGSRALGYLGLTMYETAKYAAPDHQSIADALSDTLLMPAPDRQEAYCWEVALSAGQAYMLKALYGYTGKTGPVDSLEQAIRLHYASQLKAETIERSEKFGQAVATKIYEWSKSDGGHLGYQRNFPADYTRPTGRGVWVPPVMGQSSVRKPLHPAWGQNRTFSPQNSQLPLPKPLAYSTDTTSMYYAQYKEVRDRKTTLTEADQAIVMWWGDDPGETCAPPGHSYNLATIAIRTSQADLIKAAETYARVGMAVADAFICCWKTKFTFLVERPSSFISSTINAKGQWFPFFLEPPFPSFYSGHAVQSAATAMVLTQLYGNHFSFTDDTHASRPDLVYYLQVPLPSTTTTAEYLNPANYEQYEPKFTRHLISYKARHYSSFFSAAQECAGSRLMGGIHTRYDNEVGLAEGIKIGRNINALPWSKGR